MYAAARQLGLLLTGAWYRRVHVGGELPADGPLVVVTNHSNGLVDAALPMWITRRPLRFLAKQSIFKVPGLAALARAVRAIPVYRKKDNAPVEANDDAFRAAFEALEEGGAISVFPEGTSHSEPRLIPFRTGAARLALGAEARNDFALGVRIVPVGLVYEERNAFRSRVHVWVGDALPVAHLREEYARDDREAVRRLTADIERQMRRVTLNLARHEDRPLLELGASLLDDDEAWRPARLRDLALGLRWLRANRPDRARRVVRDAERLVWRLRAHGLTPEGVRGGGGRRAGRAVLAFLALMVGVPLTVLGLAAWAPPALLAQAVARSRPVPVDKFVTVWLLLCIALVPLWLLLAACAAAVLVGWGAAGVVLVALPLLAVLAAWTWQRRDALVADLAAGLNLGTDARLREAMRTECEALSRELEALARLRRRRGAGASTGVVGSGAGAYGRAARARNPEVDAEDEDVTRRIGATRREFLHGSALGVGVLAARGPLRFPRGANERLDVGIVGVANRGEANLNGVAGENVVALCDVDSRHLARAGERFPSAKRFTDLRKMIDEVQLDAVVVSTADHTHASATLRALEAGRHVYCEKPLTHTVQEARLVAESAARHGAVTQMGTQIHAGDNYRRVVEEIRAGTIGPVRDVHVFCNKSWGADARPAGPAQDVPGHFDYDLWLGPRAHEPFHSSFHPAGWRRYWPFGGGTLGDMACHYMDLPFWALELGSPDRVHTEGPDVDAFAAPRWLVVHYRFPATDTHPELGYHWYDGGRKPAELLEELGAGGWGNGVLFVGDDGALLADYGRYLLLPEADFADHEPPPRSIESSIGHHAEWVRACKEGGPTTCSFDYSGPLTETVLLGNVAFRAGGEITWDAAALVAKGPEGAQDLVAAEYREGWELPGA